MIPVYALNTYIVIVGALYLVLHIKHLENLDIFIPRIPFFVKGTEMGAKVWHIHADGSPSVRYWD